MSHHWFCKPLFSSKCTTHTELRTAHVQYVDMDGWACKLLLICAFFFASLMQGDSDDAGSIQDSLATLSSEISIKQKLVEQLEGAQKNMHSMRQQYEAKLLTLQQQISRTESERDRVLKELGEGERERGRLIHKFQMFCSLQLRTYVRSYLHQMFDDDGDS